MHKDYKLKVKPIDQIVLGDFTPSNGHGIVNFWVPEYLDIKLIATITKYLSQETKPVLIDLGCGSGLCSRLFTDMGLEVLAIDTNKELLTQAGRVYVRSGLTFVEGSAENLKDIAKSRKIRTVNGVYCSFMPEGANWTPMIDSLKPNVIFHVLEKYGERWVSGVEEAYKTSNSYEIYGAIPLVSYRDLENLDSLSPETAGTWLVIQVRKGSLERLIKKHGKIKEFIAKITSENKYPWESELDIAIEKAQK